MIIVQGFDWDAGNLGKCTKHGLTVLEVENFLIGDVAVLYDEKHSQIEQRYLALGPGPKGRYTLVSFTYRDVEGRTFIRPISARYMGIKEVLKYAKTIAKI